MHRGRGVPGAARFWVLGVAAWVVCGAHGVCASVTPLTDGSTSANGTIKWAAAQCLAQANSAGTSCPDAVANTYGEMAGWDTSRVTDMSRLFEKARSFNADISAWDVSSVTDMSYMFSQAKAFNADLRDWDVSSVKDMTLMFYYAETFNADLSDWDVSSATHMSGMFSYAEAFNADLSKWDVSSVTSLSHMFMYASAFNADLSDWDVSSVTSMSYMFYKAHAFNADLSDWEVSSVADVRGMLIGATAMQSTYGCPTDGSLSGCAFPEFKPADKSALEAALIGCVKQEGNTWDGWSGAGCTAVSDTGATASKISRWDISGLTDLSELFKLEAQSCSAT